jgi:hypothetical protein
MNRKMTLREFFAIALPEIVPNMSEEEQSGIMRRFQNGEIGRPDIDELADLHALDEFNIQRSYDILEVRKVCEKYETYLDLKSMTHEEGELLWQKISSLQEDQCDRHHSISRNPLCRMSDRNRKAVFKLVGKPCDMVQVLQMFYEAYDSEEEQNEDANNKDELFPILRKKFGYLFIFKAEGRLLTYYYNYRNSFREGMLTDFWLNLRFHWTRFDVERESRLREIRDRDAQILADISKAYSHTSETGNLNKYPVINLDILFGKDENKVDDTYHYSDGIYSKISEICSELKCKGSFSIEEILNKCTDAITLRHQILRPIACKNDTIRTKNSFRYHESCCVKPLRELGEEYRKAARYFCIYNAQKLPIPESEEYEYLPPKIVIPDSYGHFYGYFSFRACPENHIFRDKLIELIPIMQANQKLLKKSLNLTGSEVLKNLQKRIDKYKEQDEREVRWLPSEFYRNQEHGHSMELAEMLIETAKGFDAEKTRRPVERIQEHIRELENEDKPDAPINGVEIPPGYDTTECPICGTQFHCSHEDYFHHAACPVCNEKLFVLPGMSLWNKLVEAGEEELHNPAEDPEEPVKPCALGWMKFDSTPWYRKA